MTCWSILIFRQIWKFWFFDRFENFDFSTDMKILIFRQIWKFWFFGRFENFDGTPSMRARVDERLAGNFLGGERPVAGGHLGGLLRQGAGGHDRMGQTGAWWVITFLINPLLPETLFLSNFEIGSHRLQIHKRDTRTKFFPWSLLFLNKI